jgi:hypothetical protein
MSTTYYFENKPRPMCVDCGTVPAWGENYDKCSYCLGIYCKYGRNPKNPSNGGCGREATQDGYCPKHNPVPNWKPAWQRKAA